MKSKSKYIFFLNFILFFLAFFIFNLNFFNITNGKSKQKASTIDAASTLIEDERFRLHMPSEDSGGGNRPVFDRLVILMIDALRHDFIYEDKSMHFVSQLIEEKKGLPFVFKVKTPTVTLPRLKALLSGTVPEFIDILWNFNTTRIEVDNLLDQFKKSGKNLVFYGDDTWLKLFPSENYFLRHDGVTSFVASDYDEVDKNVTRHLAFELTQNDWQVMILHYLGLDHIGHIEGPFTENMKIKLNEMDDVFAQVYESITENDARTGQSTLILLLSDHGMADHGGHGGSTKMETEIPVVFFHEKQFQANGNRNPRAQQSKFNQIDLAPTLSCLFNLKIPDQNEGVSFIDEILVDKIYNFKNFKCFHDNFMQLNRKNRLVENADVMQKYTQLRNEYDSLFHNREQIGFRSLMFKFKVLLRAIVESYSSTDTNQNMSQIDWMIVAMTGMTVSLGLLILVTINQSFSNRTLQMSTLSLAVSLLVYGLFQTELALFTLFIIGIYVFSQIIKVAWSEIDSSVMRRQHWKFDGLMKFQLASFVFYIASLFSSSFIEEEHQQWYFVELTQVLLLVIDNLRITSKKQQKETDSSSSLNQIILQSGAVLCIIRLLRSMNQTGNKWLNEADIGDFLRDNKSLLVLCVLASLSVIFYLSIVKRKRYVLISFTIFFYHFTTMYQMSTLYNRNMIAQFTYFFLILSFMFTLLKSPTSRYEIICEHLLLLFSLIQPSHNLLTICLWNIKAKLIKKLVLNIKNIYILSFFYYTISQACYFTQGNSNSLSTLQLSSSLVGLNEFSQVTSAVLLFASTYSSQIYWFCNLIHNLSLIKENSGVDYSSIIDIKLVMTSIITIAYTLCAFIQREHLFIWTVFAPKLIYQFFSVILELVLYSSYRILNKFI